MVGVWAVSKGWRDEVGDLDPYLEDFFFFFKGKGKPVQYLYPS